MNKHYSKELSSIGEDIAAKHLISCGYNIVCRNYRERCGEIDIIVEKDQHLVFVEVKTRSSHNIHTAMASISISKQRKITDTALQYINQHQQFCKHFFRFDAVIVFYCPHTDTFSVKHFPDAFYPVFSQTC
jgi:putative endonuclease